jgi:gas vesicle protein
MSKGSTFRGLIIGGMLGAAAGLLLAPRSGEDTRNILKSESQKLKDSTLKAIQDNKEIALESIAKAYEQMEELREETNQRLEQLKDITEATLEEQREILQKGVAEAKKTISTN